MHYYGFYWGRGIGTVNTDGEPIGYVEVFKSAAERDRWVADDPFDGNCHKTSMSGKEAKRIMAREVWRQGVSLAARWESMTNLVRWCPVDDLVFTYRELTYWVRSA